MKFELEIGLIYAISFVNLPFLEFQKRIYVASLLRREQARERLEMNLSSTRASKIFPKAFLPLKFLPQTFFTLKFGKLRRIRCFHAILVYIQLIEEAKFTKTTHQFRCVTNLHRFFADALK